MRGMARQVLGKGLGALLQQNETVSASAFATDDKRVILAKTEEVRSSPFQPRRHFKKEQIDELAASIKERGLIQPLVVRRVDNHFELIAGERRLRAVKSLGHKEVKVGVMVATDQEVAEITLIENLQREDLTPLEEAEQYRMLQVRFHMKQEVIARHVGKSRAMVANMVRLLELAPEVRDMLENGEITVGHAKVLLQIKDNDKQALAARNVVRRGLTVRQTEQLVRAQEHPDQPKGKTPASPQTVTGYEKICKELSRSLGTSVSITPKGRRGGVIEIPYEGQAELTRLLEIFGVTARP